MRYAGDVGATVGGCQHLRVRLNGAGPVLGELIDSTIGSDVMGIDKTISKSLGPSGSFLIKVSRHQLDDNATKLGAIEQLLDKMPKIAMLVRQSSRSIDDGAGRVSNGFAVRLDDRPVHRRGQHMHNGAKLGAVRSVPRGH